jgi:two-component system sensor histidine kinase KdpD
MLVSRSVEGFKTARVAGEEFVYDPSVLRWIHRRGIAAGPFTDQFASLPYWILPLEPRYEEGVLLLVDAHETRAVASEAVGREQYDDLKVVVQQLTLALQNERARRGESDALKERDDETVRNRLLASVAHDMRTPLATIMSAAAALNSSLDEEDPQRRHLVATIADEAGQMSKVTSNVLAMVRLQWGEQALSADWESVEELVGAVVSRHANRSTTQAKVITKVDHNLPLIWIDGPLISQVIDNLVINACRYAPSTSLIEIHAHQTSDLMIFEVIDLGPGFSPAVIAAFDGLDGRMPVADSDALLGLGLSICKTIARVHGGTLSLMNRQDGSSGALVRMSLPMRTLKSLHQLG